MYMYIVHVHMLLYMYMWLPCTFLFQQLTSLCLQNWMMSMSALVQVAAINGALVQAAAIISALVQLGCYH